MRCGVTFFTWTYLIKKWVLRCRSLYRPTKHRSKTINIKFQRKIFFDPRHLMLSDQKIKYLKHSSNRSNRLYKRHSFIFYVLDCQNFVLIELRVPSICKAFTAPPWGLIEVLTKLIMFVQRSRRTCTILKNFRLLNFSQCNAKILQFHKNI